MNTKKLMCLLCVLSLSGAAAAQDHDLVALARAEKARRAKMRAASGASRLYTESDRTGSSSSSAGATAETAGTAGAATAAPAPNGAREKTPEELAAERQKEWTDRLQQTQDQIKELEGVIQTNERNLASLINITPARADLANRIEADKQKLATLQQTLVSLEDERRRAGLPRVR